MTHDTTSESDREALLTAYHQRLAERHGPEDVRSLGWTSRETQQLRFLALWRMACSPRTGSLLDVGCGSGDLYTFLEHRGASLQYTGIDSRPLAIQDARARHPDVHFEVRDAQSCEQMRKRYDYVLASGLFGIAAVCSREYVLNMLASLWQVTGRALVFNMNSNYTPMDQRKPEDFHDDPCVVLAFCLRRLSPRVHLHHGTTRQSDCSFVVWRELPSELL